MLACFVHAVFQRLCGLLANFNDLFVSGVCIRNAGFEHGDGVFGAGWCCFRQIVDQLVNLTRSFADASFGDFGEFGLRARCDAGDIAAVGKYFFGARLRL